MSAKQTSSAARRIAKRFLRTAPGRVIGERAALEAGRRWPELRVVRQLSHELITIGAEHADARIRIARVQGRVRLALTVNEWIWGKLYFLGGGTTPRAWVHEPETTRFMLRWLRPGDSMIDVGASIGYFTALAADVVGTSGTVYAFEPLQAVLPLLRQTVSLNAFEDRVQVHSFALSDRDGVGRLVPPVDSRNMGTARLADRGGEVIELRRLDSVASSWPQGRLRLVKIDVEGRELEVLRGAEKTIRRRQAEALICEFEPLHHTDPATAWNALTAFARGLGYAPYRLDDAGRPVALESMPTWVGGNVCFLP
jgi:FkbM family methyltransferase